MKMDLLLIIGLIIALILALAFLYIGYYIGKERMNKVWEDKIPDIRQEAIKQSRGVLGGQFSEQLAPYLPDFPYSPTEVRFLGKPIDLMVFKGMDNKDIQEVVFVEVKSGQSGLSTHERKLRDVINEGKVFWEEYRIPEDITKKENDG